MRMRSDWVLWSLREPLSRWRNLTSLVTIGSDWGKHAKGVAGTAHEVSRVRQPSSRAVAPPKRRRGNSADGDFWSS
jgi:hypothetical protein